MAGLVTPTWPWTLWAVLFRLRSASDQPVLAVWMRTVVMAASTDHFTRWSWTTDRRTSGSPASLALLPLDCATGTGPWTRHFKRHFSRDRYLVSVQIWRPQVLPYADPYTSASCISKSIMFLHVHIVGRTVVLSDLWRRIRIFNPIYSMYWN